MKKFLYSAVTYSFRFAVILGIAVNLAGIILVWHYAPVVSDHLVDTATFIRKVMNSTEDLLEISSTAIGKAEENITIIAQATSDMAESMKETSSIATSISETMSEEFTDVVENTQNALSSLESSAKLVDDTLSFVASIPIIGSNYSNKTPLYNSVVEINESMMKLPDNIENLQENLDEASSAFTSLNENLVNLSSSVEEIKMNLEDAGEVITSYQALVDQAQKKTERAIEIIPSRVRWAAAGLTLLLIWGILIQAGLFVYIRDMFELTKKLEQLSTNTEPDSAI